MTTHLSSTKTYVSWVREHTFSRSHPGATLLPDVAAEARPLEAGKRGPGVAGGVAGAAEVGGPVRLPPRELPRPDPGADATLFGGDAERVPVPQPPYNAAHRRLRREHASPRPGGVGGRQTGRNDGQRGPRLPQRRPERVEPEQPGPPARPAAVHDQHGSLRYLPGPHGPDGRLLRAEDAAHAGYLPSAGGNPADDLGAGGPGPDEEEAVVLRPRGGDRQTFLQASGDGRDVVEAVAEGGQEGRQAVLPRPGGVGGRGLGGEDPDHLRDPPHARLAGERREVDEQLGPAPGRDPGPQRVREREVVE